MEKSPRLKITIIVKVEEEDHDWRNYPKGESEVAYILQRNTPSSPLTDIVYLTDQARAEFESAFAASQEEQEKQHG